MKEKIDFTKFISSIVRQDKQITDEIANGERNDFYVDIMQLILNACKEQGFVFKDNSFVYDNEAKNLALDTIKVREKANVTELDIRKIEQDPNTMEVERCCGNCCWFYWEMTDGDGFCALSDPSVNETRCDYLCSHEVYVSRQEMRHHMAVLLQYRRWHSDYDMLYYAPDGGDDALHEALDFAYKYMKVFSKL